MLPEATDINSSPLLNSEGPGAHRDAPRGLDAFRAEVMRKPELLDQLQGAVNHPEFIRNLVELGSARGFSFSPDEVDAALRDARRRWFERNVV